MHAAGESGPAVPGTYAVVLSAESEQGLRRIADRLEAQGTPVHRVVEGSGRYKDQLMALGIPPGPKSIRGKHLSCLPLLRFTDLEEYRELQQDHWTVQDELRDKLRAARRSWWDKLKEKWNKQGGRR